MSELDDVVDAKGSEIIRLCLEIETLLRDHAEKQDAFLERLDIAMGEIVDATVRVNEGL
jgi:hypothetical protein